nr:MAG TPA: hypothetical protein [Caudoviricetes sp.]
MSTLFLNIFLIFLTIDKIIISNNKKRGVV